MVIHDSGRAINSIRILTQSYNSGHQWKNQQQKKGNVNIPTSQNQSWMIIT